MTTLPLDAHELELLEEQVKHMELYAITVKKGQNIQLTRRNIRNEKTAKNERRMVCDNRR